MHAHALFRRLGPEMMVVPQTQSLWEKEKKKRVVGVVVPQRVCPQPPNNPVGASEERVRRVCAVVASAQPSSGVAWLRAGVGVCHVWRLILGM